jgi:hypothetical protein
MIACRSVATSWRSDRQAPGRVNGKLPVGRVLELVYKRLEQKYYEEMPKQIRLGGALVDPRRPFEAIGLLSRFYASSMRYLRRQSARTSTVVKLLGASDVTRMIRFAATSVPFGI